MKKPGPKPYVELKYPKLKEFLETMPSEEEKHVFAALCGTTLGYLRNVQYTSKKLGAEISVAIEKQSGKRVTRQDLHPADYDEIWPELHKKYGRV
jgi:hypothetical protein